MVKLLAVDLDGTLLRRDGQVDGRDRAAIAEARARGVAVTIVTGRLYAGTRPTAIELGLASPVACADGAQIVDPADDREIEHLGIAAEAAHVLRQALAARPLATFLLYRDQILHDRRGSPFARYVQSWAPALVEVEALYGDPCWDSERGLSGVVVVGDEADVTAAAAELRQSALLHVIDFQVKRPPAALGAARLWALLGHLAGATKGSAIHRLARLCHCRTDEVVAIGDWLNDVEMFATAGRSFVMAHAPPHVRQAATDQLRADSTTGGGVAEAVALLWSRA